ncbi:MAG: hypothetical protein WD557_11355 [Dehalococcoidia bacterium]
MEPVPDLIRALIYASSAPTAAEAGAIRERMTSVEFPTIDDHLAQRKEDRQWTAATTAIEFRSDIDEAIRAAARLGLYLRRGGYMAATIAATDRVVPTERIGRIKRPYTFVVYSADRDTLVTAYQFTSMDTIVVPGDALWVDLPA